MLLLAVHWQNTITTGSILIATIIAIIGFAEAVHMVRRKNRISDLESERADLQRELENADRTAKRWEIERNAADAAMQRLKIEHLEDKAKFAEEQREIRHNLKAELSACQMELQVATARTDQTVVLKGQEVIGSALLDGQKTIVDVIERMEERAARRDSAMLENQKKIAQSLESIAAQVVAQVGEVVQEKVDQLQPDLPSPDRKE